MPSPPRPTSAASASSYNESITTTTSTTAMTDNDLTDNEYCPPPAGSEPRRFISALAGTSRTNNTRPFLPPNVGPSSMTSDPSEIERQSQMYRRRRHHVRCGGTTCQLTVLGFIFVGFMALLLFLFIDGDPFGITWNMQCWSWKGALAGGECDYFKRRRGGEGLWWDRPERTGPKTGGRGPPSENRTVVEVPDFVTEFAPFVYLYSREQYLPSKLEEHLEHITPQLNYTPITSPPPFPEIDYLSELTDEFGLYVYLTSQDDPLSVPTWLMGAGPSEDGRTDAKATVIVADKGRRSLDEQWGIVGEGKGESVGVVTDVFYFYFYSYNLGPEVLRIRFGNHVGDWEHTMVRFVDGEPKAMFFSEHAMGAAVRYDGVHKIGKRPVAWSAKGTHANYPAPGTHRYILPFGVLADHADSGSLWDPMLNANVYALNMSANTLLPGPPDTAPSNYNLQPTQLSPNASTDWFHFDGYWGDRIYPISDRRQYGFGGQWHFVSGPTGPKWKILDRRGMCLTEGKCRVEVDLRHWGWGHGELGVGGDDEMKRKDYEDDDETAGLIDQVQIGRKTVLEERGRQPGAVEEDAEMLFGEGWKEFLEHSEDGWVGGKVPEGGQWLVPEL